VQPDPAGLSGVKCRSLGGMLLRPFVDLEPCERGPLCARGIEQYWIAFVDTRGPRFALQRALPRPFRAQLLSEAGVAEYQAEDPREVNPAIRTDRWRSVCKALDLWPELTTDQQCRLARMLHALCFYSLISSLIPDIPETEIAADADRAELAYLRASARYMLNLPNRSVDYVDADLSELERIVAVVPRDHVVAISGALLILVHKAKTGAPVEELVEWRARAERILEAALAKSDDFARALWLSRYHRAAAFVPQRQGDRAEVIRMMDLAEHYGLAMVPTGAGQELRQLENLYPVIESRTKEALWLGDMDLALAHAQRLIKLDPYDSRAWLELGQVRLKRKECAPAAEAYAAAAMLGPPSTAVGRHMAGLCYRDLGQPLLAAYFFQAAIETDSRAISPHDEIQRLPDLPVLAALKEWSLSSFEA
jgi:tetratricopeptide (TPR) repeat protein